MLELAEKPVTDPNPHTCFQWYPAVLLAVGEFCAYTARERREQLGTPAYDREMSLIIRPVGICEESAMAPC